MARTPAKSKARLARHELEQIALLAARSLVDRMRALYRSLEHRTGAPISMHRALASIAAEPGIPASRLATALGMQRPAVSHLLRGLAANGWIARLRSESDQRSVRLSITAAGRRIVSATSGRVVGTLQRAVHALEDHQLHDLTNGLVALLAKLPEETPATRMRAHRPLRKATRR